MWFENFEIINDIKFKVRIFRGFVKENECNGDIKFIFINIYRSMDEKFVMIYLYEDGCVFDFEFFGKLEKFYVMEKSNLSIILEWKGLLFGISFV